jgi:hypothetical protein
VFLRLVKSVKVLKNDDDDERLSLETCRGRKINTLEKKVKKVRQVGCKSSIKTTLQNSKPILLYNET